MKRVLPLFVSTLHFLALGLWGGAAAALLLLVPVSAFLPGTYAHLAEVCGLTMLGCQWLSRRRYRASRSLFLADGIRQLFTFSALLAAETFHTLPGRNSPRQPMLLAAQVVALSLTAALTCYLMEEAPPGLQVVAQTPLPAVTKPTVSSTPAARRPRKAR